MARRTEDILAAWNAPGWAGFSAWLADVKPRVIHSDNRYRPLVLEPWQARLLQDALAVDPAGKLLFNFWLFIMPRRHSKSTLIALVLLWLATSRPNFAAICLGNHENHSQRVQMRPLRQIIRNTPALFKLAGNAKNLGSLEIHFPALGSMIIQATPTLQSAFGDRLNALWVSDFHACPNLEAVNAIQASLLDSEERLTLIDSNTDSEGGHVHELELGAGEDPGIFCHRLEYKDFEDYLEHAPDWINRDEAKRLKRITLPASFDRDILGKRSSATNALFPPEVIEQCKDQSYKVPVPAGALPGLVGGRKYVVGAGLDRSKSLFGGDNTVLTVTAKVARPDGEPEYFVLAQDVIVPNTASLIKRALLKHHECYKLDNVTLENYEAVDLKPWLDDQNISCELVSAHDTMQNSTFPELHRVAKEGRLRFSAELVDLAKEMQTFVYSQRRGGTYSFGHVSQKFHDDRVYSLNWSIYATRARVLNLFVLPAVNCTSLSQNRRLCFLLGGDLELTCKFTCRAYFEAKALYQDYLRLRMDAPETLPEFFADRVTVAGPVAWQQM